MIDGPELQTERLLLRRWRPADAAPFAEINADPVVMEFFPSPLAPHETAALIERFEACFRSRGYGLWAVEVRDETALAGFVGLSPVEAPYPFAPAVEVGWRLARAYWGNGFATEAARASLSFGFENIGLPEIVSFTSMVNRRSRQVMTRLGMGHNPDDDFDHPRLAEGDRLRRQVLYRLRRPALGT